MICVSLDQLCRGGNGCLSVILNQTILWIVQENSKLYEYQ